MVNFKNKGISTPIAILIIVLLAGAVVGGVFYYQKKIFKEEPLVIQEKEELEKKESEEEEKPEEEIIEGEEQNIYRNQKYGFETTFPKVFEVGKDCVFGNYNGRCVSSIEKPSEQKWTVLNDGIDIYVGEEKEDLENCLKQEYKTATDIEINGIDFEKHKGIPESAMGGKRSIGYVYKTVHNGRCYTIISKFYYEDVDFLAGVGAFGEPREATPAEIREQEEKINTTLNEFEKIIKTLILF